MLIVFPRAFVTSTTFTSSVFLSSHGNMILKKFASVFSLGYSLRGPLKIHISKMFIKFRE